MHQMDVRELVHEADDDEELEGAVVVDLARPVQRHGRRGGAGRARHGQRGRQREEKEHCDGCAKEDDTKLSKLVGIAGSSQPHFFQPAWGVVRGSCHVVRGRSGQARRT